VEQLLGASSSTKVQAPNSQRKKNVITVAGWTNGSNSLALQRNTKILLTPFYTYNVNMLAYNATKV